MTDSGLVDRHIDFLEALRAAGVPVSLAEDLDAVAALGALRWDDRAEVRDGYAATLVKRHSHRPTFDTLFDLYYPRLVGDGSAADADEDSDAETGARDGAEARDTLRAELLEALVAGDLDAQQRLAVQAIGRFGAMPGRGPGLSSWSAYTALRRLSPDDLVARIVEALRADGRADDEAGRAAARRLGGFTRLVESEARRRIAEEKGPDHVADVAVRPSIERLDFTAAKRADLEEMRREIQPLARRLATRLAREQHARRRGPLDFRRTVRASISTGGVPLVTRHRPKRPHRTDLVVLCDVSGSVASFARFTLMLVFAMREQFQQVRAFTFVDQVHEVTRLFVPGSDPGDGAGVARRQQRARRTLGPHQLWERLQRLRQRVPQRARSALVAAHPGRRPIQLQRPGGPGAPRPRRRRAPRLVAQPRAPPPLGHRRLRRQPPTARWCRWWSAATSPSSAASSTTSCDRSGHTYGRSASTDSVGTLTAIPSPMARSFHSSPSRKSLAIAMPVSREPPVSVKRANSTSWSSTSRQ